MNFNCSSMIGKEMVYIHDAIFNQKSLCGNGFYTQKCVTFLEKRFKIGKALLTTSCTAALEMAAILLNLQPGDEVIVPSYTFVSTTNAFILRGAKPVFADVRADTMN
ncbi:aminotransferase class I/II-fold pyridoxal phosphate-dependent enzyme, partial [Thiotrichales bacterium HSG1]|nr:aminotransferase class I/II-fold pyridoxal phosphate-dependent enzyme [Thiotrichales bacterium HSG1]